MPFNSYEFLFIFLPVSVSGFWLVVRIAGGDSAVLWLVLASVIFYASASWVGLATLAPFILIDYLIASVLLRTPESHPKLRSVAFALGIFCNVAFLGYFKYRNFFLDTANSLFQTHLPVARLLMPLGISFLTFQKIAFLSDVRAGLVQNVRFLDYLFFTTFFPKSIAGPIVRYSEIVPQLKSIPVRDSPIHISVGLMLLSIGLFKKAFVADQLAPYVSSVFDFGPVTVWDPGTPTLITSWTAVLAYTLELYLDFSGYSDMALGLARMFAVRLPMNFNSPFKARNIVEFWGRWHITLTRFLTAYIYTPLVLAITRARLVKRKPVLAGARSGAQAILALIAIPTLITMMISGIWHGAGWQFVVWGVLHGIYLTFNQVWRLIRPRFWRSSKSYDRIMRPTGVVITFCSVMLALVFFRAPSISDALSILYAMIGGNGLIPDDVHVLRQVGVRVPSDIERLFLPITPWVWIGLLLACVMALPNSLELLRAYRPAADFPNDDSEFHKAPTGVPDPAKGWSALRVAIVAGRDGISLNPLTAAVAAVLFLLGVLMLGRGETFIYWNF